MASGKLKIFLAVSLAGLVAIPAYAWVSIFRENDLQSERIREEIEQKQLSLSNTEQALERIDNLAEEIQSLEEAMGYFKSKLPDERQISAILTEISVLVTRNNLKLQSIEPISARGRMVRYADESSPYAEQAIEVELEGDFMALYSFLQALEALPRITRIQRMTLQGMSISEVKRNEDFLSSDDPARRAQAKDPGTVRASFIMTIFYEKNGKD